MNRDGFKPISQSVEALAGVWDERGLNAVIMLLQEGASLETHRIVYVSSTNKSARVITSPWELRQVLTLLRPGCVELFLCENAALLAQGLEI
jgi:hypothetical protein